MQVPFGYVTGVVCHGMFSGHLCIDRSAQVG